AVVLDQVIRLLHPFVPFITEEIYQKLNAVAPIRGLAGLVDLKVADSLVRSAWPGGLESLVDPAAERAVEAIQAPIRAIRDIRNQYNIAPSARPEASASGPATTCELLNANAALLCHLAGLGRFHASPDTAKPRTAAATIVGDVSVFMHDVIDVAAERTRLEKKRAEIAAAKAGVEAKLGNDNFVNRAKPEVVQQARDRLAELTEQLRAAEGLLAELTD
ncbi:MAG TPA: valine--tRNA ligase, partial [Phycisphaerales bacterium]|nr:valine--tRNA ligase [Phycisphaerales bacterium]